MRVRSRAIPHSALRRLSNMGHICWSGSGDHHLHVLHRPWSGATATAPNQALVAPREARDLGIGGPSMKLVVFTPWVRAGTAPIPPDERRASRSGANPRASPQGGAGAGWREDAGRVMEPRKQ